MVQETLIKLFDKSFEIILMFVAGWVGALVKRIMRDIGAYFAAVRASTTISKDQENRLRKMEGKPPLTDAEWDEMVLSYTQGRKP